MRRTGMGEGRDRPLTVITGGPVEVLTAQIGAALLPFALAGAW
jgi:hypothetical protein